MKKIYQYLKKTYKNYSLKKKLYVVFITGLFFYILIFFGYIQIVYNFSMKKNYIKDKDRMVAEFAESLVSEMNIVNNTTISMMRADQIREYLQADSPGYTEKNNARTELYQFVNTDNYVESVYLIHPSGDSISINYVGSDAKRQNNFSRQWKKQLEEKNGRALVALNGNGGFLNNSYPVLSHMRAVYDLDTQKLIGYLVVNLSMNLLENKIGQLWDDDDCYIGIADEDEGTLAAVGDEEWAAVCRKSFLSKKGFSDINGDYRGYAVIQKPILDWGISILYISRMNIFKLLTVNFLTFFAIILALTLVFLVILSRVMTNTITEPIAVLARYMEKNNDGNLYRVSMDTCNDEIGLLKDTYNRMLVQINQLITKLLEEEHQKNKMELDVLQEQINPHFLYNTLSSIEYLTLTQDNMGAYHALQTLGNFYRNFLGGGSQIITLEKELEIARDYIELQKLRFHDIVELEIRAEDSLSQLKIPRLILQPLIENSLVHGIYPKGEKGRILIAIRRTDEKLELEVWDNGIGMEENELRMLLDDSEEKEGKHFGLRGTLMRLHYFYNIENFYEITSEPGAYTRILLQLPINK